MEIDYFTPGRLSKAGPPLASYRPALTVGALGPYLDAYTQPGELVIDLFCQGPALIREAAKAGRRALGLNINQAILLAASLPLTAIERQAVDAAFTLLAEAHKGTETLQSYIERLYRTKCATCGAQTVADAFIWERDEDGPREKRYHCTHCGDAHQALMEAPTDEADRASAARFERRGLSYWLLLDRAAPSNAPHRDRIASLLELYTPRNLAAINDLLLKSGALELAPPVRCVLDALLLDTLDRATSLYPPDSHAFKPRRLQRPTRYVEANVWRLLERALEAWRDTTTTPVPRAPTLDALLTPEKPSAPTPLSEGAVHLAPLSSGHARRDLPPECAALIIVDPPRPDTVLWHMSALWCHWLWGSRAGAPLNPFLSRRWLDKDWLWRGLRGALGAAASLLRPDGRLICIFEDENPAILEAMTLGASNAGYGLVGWGARSSGEARLVWRFEGLRSTVSEKDDATSTSIAVEVDSLSRAVAEHVVNTSLNVLLAQGEPVAWPMLHAAIYAGLAESGLLARAATLPSDATDPLSWLAETIRSALEGAPLRQISRPRAAEKENGPTALLWWLDPTLESGAAPLLSDRVELAVAEILRDVLAVTEIDLDRRICARFPGPQTPAARLVRLCLFSFGDEYAAGHWRLRPEDDLEARVAETDAVIDDLTSLGERLGFQVALGIQSAGEWDTRWLDETGHAHYVFAVRTTAVLGDLLFNPPSIPGLKDFDELEHGKPKTTPCLTLPGGRAVLVSYKLRHNPRLQKQVDRYGWQFLKFRHLRQLVQEVAAKQLDRYAFQAALGLDPIVEQEEAQLSLW